MEKEFITYISQIVDRDLNKLEEEIMLYPSEESIWVIDGQIKNSAGNLCLHVCGNLQHFIGAVLGKTDYIRNRENEFAATGIKKSELAAEIQRTRNAVKSALEKLDSAALQQEYPQKAFGYMMTTSFFLIHLSAHLGYHLGQINYHRRLLS